MRTEIAKPFLRAAANSCGAAFEAKGLAPTHVGGYEGSWGGNTTKIRTICTRGAERQKISR